MQHILQQTVIQFLQKQDIIFRLVIVLLLIQIHQYLIVHLMVISLTNHIQDLGIQPLVQLFQSLQEQMIHLLQTLVQHLMELTMQDMLFTKKQLVIYSQILVIIILLLVDISDYLITQLHLPVQKMVIQPTILILVQQIMLVVNHQKFYK